MVIISLVSLFSILFGNCSSPLSGVVSSWIPVGSLLFAHPVDVLVFGRFGMLAFGRFGVLACWVVRPVSCLGMGVVCLGFGPPKSQNP